MSIHPEGTRGKSCSDLGGVLVLNDPAVRASFAQFQADRALPKLEAAAAALAAERDAVQVEAGEGGGSQHGTPPTLTPRIESACACVCELSP